MVFNANYNYQSPEGLIDPAVLEAYMNGPGGEGCDPWAYGESALQPNLNNGYTEVPQQEIPGENQCWDEASFGTLINDPQSQLTGQAGFQQSSLPAQDVALANNLAFPLGSLPPVPPPDYINYEGRHNLKAPWEYGDHTTGSEFEESTIAPSRSNTHTRVPSGGSNSNTGTSATLVELGPVNGVADHAPSTDDNNELQKDTKKDKGKDLAVEDTPTPPSNVEHWIGAVDTTTQESPNQSATPPHEFLAACDFNDVDRSALAVAGLTVPEDNALYHRRAVGAEFVPPPLDMNGASGMQRLPPVPAPDIVRAQSATMSTAPEPDAFARHPRLTDLSPSSSRTTQAAAPSSKKRKAADSGTGAPAKKQSHHDKMQSRQDKQQSRPRRPKDPKTSAKKHKHAEAGHEYFTLTHSNWILRLPAEDENVAQAGSSGTDSDAPYRTSSTGTSSSDAAPVDNASPSNDASASAQNGDDFVQGDEPVTPQHAAWHSKQERPIVQQAPFRFGRERDLRRRAQYGPDTLARIERENAAAATSSSNVSPNGSASPNASSSSIPPLDIGPRGHGGRPLGDCTIHDRARPSNTKDGSNEAALAGPSPAIASAPTYSSMRSGSEAMQLPLEEPMAATSSRLDDSLQSPHYMVSHQPPHTYQQYAPPQYAPAGWYAHSYEMPQPYDAPPNPYTTPTAYPPPAPHSWSYSPPAGFYAPCLNPDMIGNIHYYPHYEQEFSSASNQDPSHDYVHPSYDPSYGEDGWYY